MVTIPPFNGIKFRKFRIERIRLGGSTPSRRNSPSNQRSTTQRPRAHRPGSTPLVPRLRHIVHNGIVPRVTIRVDRPRSTLESNQQPRRHLSIARVSREACLLGKTLPEVSPVHGTKARRAADLIINV